MEEFTDYETLDLEKLSDEILDSFCDRYLQDALRVLNTGLVYASDVEMLRLSTGIVLGLYFKKLTETIESGEKVIH